MSSSVIIKIDGVEVAVVSPGLSPTVINLKLPGHNYMSWKVSQILAGLVCIIFCWTSPYYNGIWTGIPLILTGVFYIVSEIKRHPGWLLASSIMNILSFLLAVGAIILFSFEWRWQWQWYGLKIFVLLSVVFGKFCSIRTLFPPRLGHTSQQFAELTSLGKSVFSLGMLVPFQKSGCHHAPDSTLEDTKPLWDPQPPSCGEKPLTVDTD